MQTSLAELAVLQELEVRPSRGSVTEVREIFAYSCIYIYIYLFFFTYVYIYIYTYMRTLIGVLLLGALKRNPSRSL